MANSPRFVRFFNLWGGTNWPEIKSSLIQRAVTWHHQSHLADLADEQTAAWHLAPNWAPLGSVCGSHWAVWIRLGSVDYIGHCVWITLGTIGQWAVCVGHIGQCVWITLSSVCGSDGTKFKPTLTTHLPIAQAGTRRSTMLCYCDT